MARTNIRIGPITQFWRRESPTIFRSRKTSPISSYFTLAKGGYIIRMSPTAIGMLVVPTWNELMNPSTPGTNMPMATPAAMAAKIQNGKPAVEEGELPRDAVGHQTYAGFVARTNALIFPCRPGGPPFRSPPPPRARGGRLFF